MGWGLLRGGGLPGFEFQNNQLAAAALGGGFAGSVEFGLILDLGMNLANRDAAFGQKNLQGAQPPAEQHRVEAGCGVFGVGGEATPLPSARTSPA